MPKISKIQAMTDKELDEAIEHWKHVDLKFELDRVDVIELLKEVKRLRMELDKK